LTGRASIGSSQQATTKQAKKKWNQVMISIDIHLQEIPTAWKAKARRND